jgi:hypothetical protein
MKLNDLPLVLSWSTGADLMASLHESYVERLFDRLGFAIGRVARGDAARAERLHDVLCTLPDAAFARLLTAPETSYRLLWPSHHTSEGVAAFLEQSAHAERARMNGGDSPGTTLWTALGDMRFSPDAAPFAAARLDGKVPADFDSPQALAPPAAAAGGDRAREGFTGVERHVVLDRLSRAWRGIGAASLHVRDFVQGFTKVVVLQKDTTRGGFSSNSRDDRIGRSAMRNPQVDTVDEVDLADGLVHEAIHSLLHMHEHHHRWFRDDRLYSPEERVVSPWSGNRLPVRYFFHAVFVWYGLLQFWCRAVSRNAFAAQERARIALSRAARGFLGPPITERVVAWQPEIAPSLLTTIDHIQAHVIASIGDVAAAAT